jgi:hypothetical protein
MELDDTYYEPLKEWFRGLEGPLFEDIFGKYKLYKKALLNSQFDLARILLDECLSLLQQHAATSETANGLVPEFESLIEDLHLREERHLAQRDLASTKDRAVVTCVFCGVLYKNRDDVGVAGPGVFICRSCIDLFVTDDLCQSVSDSLTRCSFCARVEPDVSKFVVSAYACICDECLELCYRRMHRR